MIERGLIYLAQLRTANGGKLKTNSLMSKSDKLNQRGAAASRSECVQKTLDSERRLIDDRINHAAYFRTHYSYPSAQPAYRSTTRAPLFRSRRPVLLPRLSATSDRLLFQLSDYQTREHSLAWFFAAAQSVRISQK